MTTGQPSNTPGGATPGELPVSLESPTLRGTTSGGGQTPPTLTVTTPSPQPLGYGPPPGYSPAFPPQAPAYYGQGPDGSYTVGPAMGPQHQGSSPTVPPQFGSDYALGQAWAQGPPPVAPVQYHDAAAQAAAIQQLTTQMAQMQALLGTLVAQMGATSAQPPIERPTSAPRVPVTDPAPPRQTAGEAVLGGRPRRHSTPVSPFTGPHPRAAGQQLPTTPLPSPLEAPAPGVMRPLGPLPGRSSWAAGPPQGTRPSLIPTAVPDRVHYQSGGEIRLLSLPRLGEKEGELPYTHWTVEVQAILEASEVLGILYDDRPSETAPEALHWFDRANAKVYAALLQAVRSVAVLGDKCRLVGGFPGSARLAWETIRTYYVRLSENTSFFLLKKLKDLRPSKNETMEVFLLRCDLLREEYARYGLQLEDSDLIRQVFSSLERMWLFALGGTQDSLARLDWGTIKTLLLHEDTSRRQANLSVETTMFPLGHRTSGGQASVTSPQSSPAHSRTPSPPRWRQRKSPRGSRDTSPVVGRRPSTDLGAGPSSVTGPEGGRRGRRRPPSEPVCFYCKKPGHMANNCSSCPPGWTSTEEDRREAYQIKSARDKKGKQVARPS